MKQCSNGHLYDETKSSSCPYCSGNSLNQTQPLNGFAAPAAPVEPEANSFPKTQALDAQIPPTGPIIPAYGVTERVDETPEGICPVRGWLVVVSGPKKGLDFKIRGEKSNIGRNKKYEISVDFDRKISSEACAVIQYDMNNNIFYISVGGGSNSVYVNTKLLLQSTQLFDYDVIKAGDTEFVFRSLCNETFKY